MLFALIIRPPCDRPFKLETMANLGQYRDQIMYGFFDQKGDKKVDSVIHGLVQGPTRCWTSKTPSVCNLDNCGDGEPCSRLGGGCWRWRLVSNLQPCSVALDAIFFMVGFLCFVLYIAGYLRFFRNRPLFHHFGSWRWVFPRSSQIVPSFSEAVKANTFPIAHKPLQLNFGIGKI